ncbi:MAG: hypothetical protein Q4C63_07215 [Eubacteriales bacterium]|nr:hypothetical protein [Eubacteriales bacterium]
MSGKYDDMIGLQHPTSKRHPRMSNIERAAQFSPFAALTGYEDAINETGRLTDQKMELSEERKAVLDRALSGLSEHIADMPAAAVTYFEPDPRKNGGEYVRYEGRVRSIDEVQKQLRFSDGKEIALSEIIEIDFPHGTPES